jgi:uncharacterized membrane protein
MSHAGPPDQQAEQRLQRRLPEIYVLCALFVTLLLAILTPPFFVPDEANHSLRALQLAHGQVLATAAREGAGGQADRNAYAAMSRMNSIISTEAELYPMARSRPDGRISRGDMEAVQQLTWAHADQFSPFPNTAVYPPTLYLPQAAGWAAAEHLNLHIVHGLVLARLCAALIAVFAGWLALRYAACCRTQIFLLLLLPTCLSLNASTSQDAVLFGLAALAAACLSRPLQQQRQFRSGELVLTTMLLTVCIGARVPYLPMLLVLFLPALNASTFVKKSLLAPSAAAICGALIIAAWQSLVKPFGILTGPVADVAKQQAFLHAHPAYSALVVGKSAVLGSFTTVLKGLALLGTNDAYPPMPVYGLFVAAILVILLLSTGGCLQTNRARLVLVGAAMASAAGMSLAEYLIWSAPGASAVAGLQARYYLPLLLLLALALPAQPLLRIRPRGRSATLLVAYVVFLGCVLTVPLVAAHRFYHSGLVAALYETAR